MSICDHCKFCRIVPCNFIDPDCRLLDADVVKLRPELLGDDIAASRRRERHLTQLADARRMQKWKRAGRRNYHKTLGPVVARRQKLAAMGFKRYDGRVTRGV